MYSSAPTVTYFPHSPSSGLHAQVTHAKAFLDHPNQGINDSPTMIVSGQHIIGPLLARLSRIDITSPSEALLWSLVSPSALGYQLLAKGDWNSGSTLHLDHTAGYISKGGL